MEKQSGGKCAKRAGQLASRKEMGCDWLVGTHDQNVPSNGQNKNFCERPTFPDAVAANY